MELQDILNILKVVIGAAISLYFFIQLLRRLKRVGTKFKTTAQEIKGLPDEERLRIIESTKAELGDDYFSQGLYWKFFSTLFVVFIMLIPFTVFLIWLVAKGLRFPLVYFLIASSLFLTPLFIMNLVMMGAPYPKKAERSKFTDYPENLSENRLIS